MYGDGGEYMSDEFNQNCKVKDTQKEFTISYSLHSAKRSCRSMNHNRNHCPIASLKGILVQQEI